MTSVFKNRILNAYFLDDKLPIKFSFGGRFTSLFYIHLSLQYKKPHLLQLLLLVIYTRLPGTGAFTVF